MHLSLAPVVRLTVVAALLGAGLVGCSSTQQADAPLAKPQNAAVTATSQKISDRPHRNFGLAMQGDPNDVVSADVVLASLEDYDGRQVRLYGKVSEVCAKRGCWMRVSGENTSQAVFVKFTCPIEGRLIPQEALDKPVVVEGRLVRAKMSEAQARHFAQDGGATPEEIAAIKGPQPVLAMKSASARVLDLPASVESPDGPSVE